jgi:gliding motility-associated-like protein
MKIFIKIIVLFFLFLNTIEAQSNFKTPTRTYSKGQLRVSSCNFQVDTTATSPPSCSGMTDGSAFFTYTGVVTGGGLLTYNLDNLPPQNGNPAFIQLLGGGVHTLIAVSPDGCRDTLVFTLASPNPINLNFVIDSVTCNGGVDGKAVAAASGGFAPYGYIWNTAFATFGNTATNLIAGPYTCTVTDSKGCKIIKTVDVFQPAALANTYIANPVNCSAPNSGSITYNQSGGTPSYTYNWSGPNSFSATTSTISNLIIGTYNVTATDAHGCSQSQAINLIAKPAFNLSLTKTDVSCFGGNNGSINSTVTNGVPPYNYQWSNGFFANNISNLTAGFYKVTVTDNTNCKVTDTITIKQNPKLEITLASQGASCASIKNGFINTTTIGGVSPYTYAWTGSALITANLTNLGSGTYTITVTDSKGCTATETTSLLPTTVQTINIVTNNPTCNLSKNGTADATLVGGSSPITYTWNNGTNVATLSNLAAGTYFVTATDAKGCKTLSSAILIAPPAIVMDSIVEVMPKCFGDANGSIKLFPSGGTGTFTYKWNDVNAQFKNPATGLKNGLYSATVTDSKGCTTTITKLLNQPNAMSVVLKATDVKCFGGTDAQISNSVLNGKLPFQYLWNDATAQTAGTAINLNTGTYTLKVTDANGCSSTQTAKVNQPAKALTFLVDQTFTSCPGVGQNVANIAADGGTPGYNYKWSNGSINKNIGQLKKGTYIVTVTDANGCKAVDSLKIKDLDSIKINILASAPSCFGKKDGKLAINAATGGVGSGVISNYIINWNTVPLQIGDIASSLTGNKSYTVTVSDQQGCSVVQNVFLGQPQKIKATVKTTAPKCFAGTDASLEISVNAANPVASYQWSANANGQTTPKITGVASGFYNVIVTDNKGCTFDTTVLVTQPAKLEYINLVKTDVVCNNQSNGALALAASGGISPYTYNWSNGSVLNATSKLVAGNYKLTISDANACKFVESFEIKEPSPMNATIETQDVTCFGDTDGKMDIAASGGTAPYLFSSDGINYNGINKLIGLKAGTYSIFLKDKNNCFATFASKIATPGKFSVTIQKDTVIQAGETVDLFVTQKNGIGKISYKWAGSQGITCDSCKSQNIKPLNSVSYKVYAIDENGCKAEDDVSVLLKRNNGIQIPTGFTPNGDAINSVLMVHGKDETTILEFKVFDRWGEQLHEAGPFKLSDALANGWDGNFRAAQMPSGIYVWYVNVQYADGSKEMVKGNTTLIR